MTRCADEVRSCPSPGRAQHRGGGVRFDPTTEPHHHAVCDGCGVIHDIPIVRVDCAPPSSDPTSFLGFRVLREPRTYRDLCAQCTASPVS